MADSVRPKVFCLEDSELPKGYVDMGFGSTGLVLESGMLMVRLNLQRRLFRVAIQHFLL